MAKYSRKDKEVVVSRLRALADMIEIGDLSVEFFYERGGQFSYLTSKDGRFSEQSIDSGKREAVISYENPEIIAEAAGILSGVEGPVAETTPSLERRLYSLGDPANAIYGVKFRGDIVEACDRTVGLCAGLGDYARTLLDKGYILVSEEIYDHCVERLGAELNEPEGKE